MAKKKAIKSHSITVEFHKTELDVLQHAAALLQEMETDTDRTLQEAICDICQEFIDRADDAENVVQTAGASSPTPAKPGQ